MMKLWYTFAFHVLIISVFVKLAFGYTGDEVMIPNYNNQIMKDYRYNYESNNYEIEKEEYLENIHLKTTFVSYAESFGKMMKGIITPFSSILSTNDQVLNSFSNVLGRLGKNFTAIFPGTAWCGAGNIADNKNDVGLFQYTDSCCRSHDMCNNILHVGQAKYGLINNGIFTRSHCKCDTRFYKCLKNIISPVAMDIGYTYFNLLRPQCFKKEYPANCIRRGRKRLMSNKCVKYEYDNSTNQIWQWFDNPDFY